MTCQTCIYARPKDGEFDASCRRYPIPTRCGKEHWCGEWRSHEQVNAAKAVRTYRRKDANAPLQVDVL